MDNQAQNGTSNVSLRLTFVGKTHLLPNGKLFQTDMQRLCVEAGLSGEIKLNVLAGYARRVHRVEGVHVHAPGVHGVPIAWWGADGRDIKVMLSGYGDINVAEIYERLRCSLKTKQPKTDTTEKGETDVKTPDTKSVLAKILGEDGSKNVVALPTLPAQPSVEPEQARTPLSKFNNDPDAQALFVMELANAANENGEVSLAECVSILKSVFGFPESSRKKINQAEYQQPYDALRVMVRKGLLNKHGSTYRIPVYKFRELRVQKPEAIEATLVETNVVKTEVVPASVEPTKLEKKFEALTERVKLRRSEHQRLLDLTQERLEVVLQLEHLEAHKSALERDMAAIGGGLEDPQAKEDEAAYNAIMQLLNR